MPDEVTTEGAPPAPAADAEQRQPEAAVTPPAGGASGTSGGAAGTDTVLGAPDGAAEGEKAAAPAEGTKSADAGTEYTAADLAAPEGSALTPADVERIAATARARGLSKDAAQYLIDSAAAERLTAREAAQTAIRDAAAKQVAEWNEAWKADPALGATLEEREALVRKMPLAVQRLLDDDPQDVENVRKFFNDSALGSHPSMVRLFAKLVRKMGEGSLALPNGNAGSAPRSLAETLYGDSMNPKPAA